MKGTRKPASGAERAKRQRRTINRRRGQRRRKAAVGREASLEPSIKRKIFTTSPTVGAFPSGPSEPQDRPVPGGWQSISSDLPPAGRRYNPAVYAAWSEDGFGPKFGPKRADTHRYRAAHERTLLPLKRLTEITFLHEAI